MSIQPDEELLSPAEVAKRLGITRQTVCNHVRSGKLTGYRVGHQLRIPEASLAAYLRPCRDLDALADELAQCAPVLTEQQRARVSALLRILAAPLDANKTPLSA